MLYNINLSCLVCMFVLIHREKNKQLIRFIHERRNKWRIIVIERQQLVGMLLQTVCSIMKRIKSIGNVSALNVLRTQGHTL